MPTLLKYGVEGVVALDLPPQRLLAECGAARPANISDVRAAAAAALASPIDFPPLARAIVPGDRAVVTIEPDTPQRASVVAAVVEVLLSAGVSPADILILQACEDALLDPTRELAESVRREVRRAVHDPHDASQFRYLASTQSGQRVYLHHAIVDADVLAPIGCSRCDAALLWREDLAGVYPTMSNQETRLRFRRAAAAEGARGSPTRFADEIREVMWLLGTSFAIQVIPGQSGGASAVLAGGFEPVRIHASAEANRQWTWQVSRPAGLVMAGIAGGPEQQTWRNIGRALAAAARAVTPDGAIALCTELDAAPSAGLRRIGQADDLHSALRAMQRERADDVQVTTHLAAALDRARVYLLSRLVDAAVEELGMTPLADAAEVARLAQRHNDCLVLSNAQNAVVDVGKP